MRIKSVLTPIKRVFRIIIHVLRYGGITYVNVSEINYGELFNDNDVILVSGGTKGIGLDVAKKLLKEGAIVIITGRNKDSLEKVHAQIGSKRLFYIDLDISKTNQIEEKITYIEEKVGKPITALVNNAGIYSKSLFPDCAEEDAMKVFSTNAIGTLALSQVLCKRWLISPSEKTKKIINISSQGGFVGANNAYRMTKWGIRGLTSYMGRTLCDKNIIVNGIAPGFVMTDMQPVFQKQGDNFYTEFNPIKRIAKPCEIAELAAFLLSNAANFIVGQTICCDGGYSLK